MKIIQEREYLETVFWRLMFDVKGKPGSGYAFPCSESGVLTEVNAMSAASHAECLAHPEKYEAPRVVRCVSRGEQPRIGLCDGCGEQVFLEHFTNTCSCGIDYNMSGQRLADREQWGEETGESLSDLMRIR